MMTGDLKEPKVLILDNDQAFLSQCQSELQKYGMTPLASGSDVLDAVASQIVQYKPDVIIADLYIGKIDSAQFICETRRQLCGNDPHFIIISSYNDRNLFQECCEAGAAYCMIKPIDFTILSERINKVCDIKKRKAILQSNVPTAAFDQNDLEAQVTKVLHQLGIPAHIKGYSYLRFAVVTVIKDATAVELITKILYPMIARTFGTTASRAERAMRHAIEVAWARGDLGAQDNFFGYTVQSHRGKPTNSEFIALIADSLRLKNRGAALRHKEAMHNASIPSSF